MGKIQEIARDPRRGAIEAFLGELGPLRSQSPHSHSLERWLEDTVAWTSASAHVKALDKQLLLRQKQESAFTGRCGGNAPKRRLRTATGRIYSRILQSFVFGSQEGRQMETGHRPLQSEQVCRLPDFQNGNSGIDKSKSQEGRVGHLDRPHRRLLPYPSVQVTEKVLPDPGERDSVPVHCDALRAQHCSKDLHRSSEGVKETGFDTRLQTEPVSRRLDQSLFDLSERSGINSEFVAPSDTARTSTKLKEVTTDTGPGLRPLRVPVQPSIGVGIPNPPGSGEDSESHSDFSELVFAFGSPLAVSRGPSLLCNEDIARQPVENKRDSVASQEMLEVLDPRIFGDPDSSTTLSSSSDEVVHGTHKYVERLTSASTFTPGTGVYRFQHKGLGGGIVSTTKLRECGLWRSPPFT